MVSVFVANLGKVAEYMRNWWFLEGFPHAEMGKPSVVVDLLSSSILMAPFLNRHKRVKYSWAAIARAPLLDSVSFSCWVVQVLQSDTFA